MDVRFRTFIVGLIALLTSLIEDVAEVAKYAIDVDVDYRTITVRARYKENGLVFHRNATVDVASLNGRLYRGRSSRFSQDVTVMPCDDESVADFSGNVIALHSLDEVLEAIHRANGVL